MASNDGLSNNSAHLLHSKKVKSQLQEVFREMTDKISHANFDAIFKHFKDAEIAIQNEEQLVETFKDKLHRKITNNLNHMWHDQNIDVKLTWLNFCKEKCKDNTTSWRPTGKTPEEQTKYLRLHHLKKKIGHLQHALGYQQQCFDMHLILASGKVSQEVNIQNLKCGTFLAVVQHTNVIVKDVEEKRIRYEKFTTKRDDISNQMTLRMEQINAEDKVYKELQRKLCE